MSDTNERNERFVGVSIGKTLKDKLLSTKSNQASEPRRMNIWVHAVDHKRRWQTNWTCYETRQVLLFYFLDFSCCCCRIFLPFSSRRYINFVTVSRENGKRRRGTTKQILNNRNKNHTKNQRILRISVKPFAWHQVKY